MHTDKMFTGYEKPFDQEVTHTRGSGRMRRSGLIRKAMGELFQSVL